MMDGYLWQGAQLCALDDHSTPCNKVDNFWICIVDTDVQGPLDNIAVDANSDLWFTSPNGISYLHIAQ
jgi:hypothetical protein